MIKCQRCVVTRFLLRGLGERTKNTGWYFFLEWFQTSMKQLFLLWHLRTMFVAFVSHLENQIPYIRDIKEMGEKHLTYILKMTYNASLGLTRFSLVYSPLFWPSLLPLIFLHLPVLCFTNFQSKSLYLNRDDILIWKHLQYILVEHSDLFETLPTSWMPKWA